ncbi:MAG: carbamoyltransferase HypF, partial [Leptolyngbyaceae cyanobacterium]
DKPLHAVVQRFVVTKLDPIGYTTFEIHHSDPSTADADPHAQPAALILPDLATCPACLAELFDPSDRRYRYPLINCTHCGPRYSIVRSLPYDRDKTTMQAFPMCPQCQQEYDDPGDRRFHAQPTACHHCGPHLEFWDQQGNAIATHEDALQQAIAAIRQGQILAVKGLGGFHLMADATNNAAVTTLRQRKHRPHKPFAVMYPNLGSLRDQCDVSEAEAELLESAIAPIVLVAIKNPQVPFAIAPATNPGNPLLGVMLPYTPLHHLLLRDLGHPIIATSGNLSGAPLCYDNQDALEKLGAIADGFLVHNRPIEQPTDDSIVRFVPLATGEQQPMILRRARGYAPLPIPLPEMATDDPKKVILAVGGHHKNTIALYANDRLLLSQHLGDLDNVAGCDRFQSTIQHLCQVCNLQPTHIAHDLHPDYHSTQFAKAEGRRQKAENQPQNPKSKIQNPSTPHLTPVQHHYAHLLAALADNQWQPPAFGITWDGTGYGLDQTIWGGEILWLGDRPTNDHGFERVAHLRSFPLPGGEKAVKDPRRCAWGLLYEVWDDRAFEIAMTLPQPLFEPQELQVLQTMLQRGLNSPRTSSMGRLFDGVSALINCCRQVTFEGQAAMALEYAAAGRSKESRNEGDDGMAQHHSNSSMIYPYSITNRSLCTSVESKTLLQFDYESMLSAIINDLQKGVTVSQISATFHNTLIAGFAQIMQTLSQSYPGTQQVVLTGGCFQNHYLLTKMVKALESLSLSVGWHHQIPPNDGGIAVGQVMAVLRQYCQQDVSTHVKQN